MKKFLLLSFLSVIFVLTAQSQCSVNAGLDLTVCVTTPSIGLSGSVTGGTGTWTSSGTGTFSNPASPTSSYIFSTVDQSAGAVTLTFTVCGSTSDAVVISLVPLSTISAGPDLTSCGTSPVTLSCSYTSASSVDWSSTNGSGVFSPNNTSATVSYIPTAADVANGSVDFMVRTIPGNGCASQFDQLTLTLIPAATVNAGYDQTICSGSAVTLNGTLSTGNSAQWTSSGSGTFYPNSNTLTAIYTPSLADQVNGSITFSLSTTGTGACPSSTDNVTVTIAGGTAATVDAGPDQVVLSGNVTLSGSATSATSTIWTSSGSGSFSNPSTLNPTYTPSTADYNNGMVVLTLTAASTCGSVTDKVLIKLGATYSISGTLTHNSAAVNDVYVVLFKRNGSVYFPYSEQLASSGSYTFSELGVGSYYVFAIPTLAADRSSMYPVYYGAANTSLWNDAQAITITNASQGNINIAFPSYSNTADAGWNSGTDNLSGQVTDASGTALRTTSATNTPLQNVLVSLIADNGLVDYTLTDAQGYFNFSNLRAGNYSMAIQYAGLDPASVFTSATVDGNSSGNEFVTIPLNASTTTPVLNAGAVMQANVYPNPTTNDVTISLPVEITGNLQVEAIDEMGISFGSHSLLFTNGKANFSLSSLAKGMYIIRVKEQDAIYQVRIVKM